MDLPRVIIKEGYREFLEGKEVEVQMTRNLPDLEAGSRIMGYHDSIAGRTDVTVPRTKQSQYIGIEGIVTEVNPQSNAIKVRKV